MPRGRRKNTTRSIGLIILAIMLVGAGIFAYQHLLTVIQPTPDPATWPKIKGVWLGSAYIRTCFFWMCTESERARVNFYYRPIVWDEQYRQWRELNPSMYSVPISYMTMMHGAEVWQQTVKTPTKWIHDFQSPRTIFRFDPDDENGLLPDVFVVVEYKGMIQHPTIPQYRVASYLIHVGIIGTSTQEYVYYYKGAYANVVIDPHYLIRGIRIDQQDQPIGEEILQDESGGVKIQLLIPSNAPESDIGNVDPIRFALNLKADEKMVYKTYNVEVIFDTTVQVHTATKTITVPASPSYGVTYTQGGTMPMVTTTFTMMMPVTTTRTIRETVVVTIVSNTPTTITYTATYTVTHTLTNTGWKTTVKTVTITQPETTTVTVLQTVEAPIVPPELAETFKIAVIALAVLGGIALMIFGVRVAGAKSRARGRMGGGRR